jgi:hypothetical protein
LHPPSGSSPKAEAEFGGLTSEHTLVAGIYASRFTAAAAYVDTHSYAVVRMESEQNSSTLRHYLNLYVRISGGPLGAVEASHDSEELPMQTIKTIGFDIAKSVFQVHGVDAGGEVVIRRQLKRRHVLAFFQKLPPCLVGIEACASSHYWSRELQALGHTVR